MSKEFDKSVYNETYYTTSFGGIPYNRDAHNGHWVHFFSNIAKIIQEKYAPKRTLDVGCAKGFIVESLRDLGVNAFGFDVSEVAISEVRADIKPYCVIGSIDDAAQYQGQYDLITCIEVLEHVPHEMAERAIELMCSHSNQIIFSSSPSDFDEPTHINVQPPIYWDNIFSKYGFVRAHEEWPSEHIAPHTLMYRRRSFQIVEGKTQEIKEIISSGTEFVANKISALDSSLETQYSTFKNSLELQHSTLNDSLDTRYSILNTSIEIQNAAFKALIDQIKGLSEQIAITKQEKGQIDILIDNNNELKEEINSLIIRNNNSVSECSNLNGHLSELRVKEDNYLNIINFLKIQISQLNEQLDRIKSGKTFRLMTKYWSFRDKMLPLHSRRREFVKTIVKRKRITLPPIKPVQVSDDAPINVDLWNTGFLKWLERSSHPDHEVLSKQAEEVNAFSYRPLVSVLLPVYKIPLEVFKETIESVKNQSYDNWEICMALADLEKLELVSYVKDLEQSDGRVKVVYLEKNGGISANTNECLKVSSGEFIALLDHDDLLTPDALFHMIKAINNNPEADFLYSDKDQTNAEGTARLNPLFKHKWSWATMLSANYPTHFCLIRTSIFRKTGIFDSDTDGAQDWDMFLKVSEHAREIVHVPLVLYHWRIIETSVASGIQAKPYVIEAQNNALNNFIQRKGFNGKLVRHDNHTFQMVWNKNRDVSFDTIIYTNKNTELKDLLITLNSLKEQRVKPGTVIILLTKKIEGYFDTYKNNFNIHLVSNFEDITQYSEGDCLFFVKAGIRFFNPETTFELYSWITEGEYAVASGKMIDSNRCIINAGYVFNQNNEVIEPFKAMSFDAYTTYGSVNWYRDYLAVTELAVMFNKSKLFDVVSKIENSNTVRELLLNAQIEITKRDSKALYIPYIIMEISKSDNEVIKVSTRENLKDMYFNANVWDWNPIYLNSRFLPKPTESRGKVDNSIWAGYTSDVLVLSTLYDFTNKDLDENKKIIESNMIADEKPKTALWFLPPFSSAFYGGIHTILRFAEYLKLQHSISNQFVIVGIDDIESVKSAIEAAFPNLSDCIVHGLSSDYRINALPVTDISFCTLWTTAYTLLKYNKTKRKFYFLQDWEPLFYPAGSTSAQVEATFRFGFTAICNTISLQKSYEELGGKAVHFTPAVDTSVFYPPIYEREEKPYLVFLYGRPGNPRNGFELAIPALKKVKEHFKQNVRIISAGAEWNVEAYGAEGIIEHLGMLPYKATGDLYRQCHVGLAMMMTRHPSYLPFELMACGCLVVANKNNWNEWMLKDEENCKISEPSISCVATTIIDVLESYDNTKLIAQRASQQILKDRSNWNIEFSDLCSTLF